MMTRRACYTHTLEQLTLAEPTVLRLFSHAAVLYVIRAVARYRTRQCCKPVMPSGLMRPKTVVWSHRPVPACN
jgi:hypothetical protein